MASYHQPTTTTFYLAFNHHVTIQLLFFTERMRDAVQVQSSFGIQRKCVEKQACILMWTTYKEAEK